MEVISKSETLAKLIELRTEYMYNGLIYQGIQKAIEVVEEAKTVVLDDIDR